MRAAGIDENGLGPRLGPLVVTGTWIEAREIGLEVLRSEIARPFDVRDSKQVFSQKGLSRGEETALTIIGALTGKLPRTSGELVESLETGKPGSLGTLALPCEGFDGPAGLRQMCLASDFDLPMWAGAHRNLTSVRDRAARLAAVLSAAGVTSAGITCRIACPWELNGHFASGTSKSDVDLGMFLQVGRRIRSIWGGAGSLTCGKIGARKSYSASFCGRVRIVEETRERSRYVTEEMGEVAFVLDADDTNPLVSMASLVGKYVREIAMESVHRASSALVPGLKRPSGYHDPVTERFVREAGTALSSRLPVVSCFERMR